MTAQIKRIDLASKFVEFDIVEDGLLLASSARASFAGEQIEPTSMEEWQAIADQMAVDVIESTKTTIAARLIQIREREAEQSVRLDALNRLSEGAR